MDNNNARQAPEFLTYAEAAFLLRISPEHLRRLKLLGKIPAHKPFGGRVLFIRDELEKLVREAGMPQSQCTPADRLPR